MPSDVAPETAYYLNTASPTLALIGQGVRFPAGQWLKIADGAALAWDVEELVRDLFPALRDVLLSFHVLLTDFDLAEFEQRVSADRVRSRR